MLIMLEKNNLTIGWIGNRLNLRPIDLISHYRFDVVIKYIYARAIVNNYQCSFFQNAYKEHLRVWNNFIEYDNPSKNSFNAYDLDFKNIISSFLTQGFLANKSQIPIYDQKYILNGAHRLAAALACNIDVSTVAGRPVIDGQLDCSYKMFQKLGLDSKYFDIASIEYAKLKKNSYLIFIFPAALGRRGELENIILKNANIFYQKEIQLNTNGSLNLIKALYWGESWGGDHSNGFAGFKNKQELCFTNASPLKVYLVDFDSPQISVDTKKEIRNLYNIGNHCAHINDTHEETVRLAKTVFNNNSLHHLNNSKTANYKVFNQCLRSFKNKINELGLDIDDYCVTASSTLSTYGLREGDDLDYLHSNPTLIPDSTNLIHSHNVYGVGRYHLHRDEIIYNPDNHFYYRGVKFASLDVVKHLKEKRSELKDKKDIELINSI